MFTIKFDETQKIWLVVNVKTGKAITYSTDEAAAKGIANRLNRQNAYYK